MNKTRELTEITMLLILGLIIKVLTDIFTRTFFSFLLLDPFSFMNVVILIKYPKWKNMILLCISETILSLFFFISTDIWFLRPIFILITFFSVLLINNLFKTKNIKFRYLSSIFASRFITFFLLGIIMLLLFNFYSDSLHIKELLNQTINANKEINKIFNSEQITLLNKEVYTIINVSIIIFMTIYNVIISGINTVISMPFLNIFKIKKTTL